MRRVVVLVVLGALGWWLAAPYVSALALVIDLSGQDVALRRWLPVTPQTVTAASPPLELHGFGVQPRPRRTRGFVRCAPTHIHQI